MRKAIIFSITFVSVSLAAAGIVYASEVTGSLSAGGMVEAPVANPSAGSYNAIQSVSLVANGASNIYFTVDGTVPNCSASSTLYDGNIAVSTSETISAIACYPGNLSSEVATFAYEISIPQEQNTQTNGGTYTVAGGPFGLPASQTQAVTTTTTGTTTIATATPVLAPVATSSPIIVATVKTNREAAPVPGTSPASPSSPSSASSPSSPSNTSSAQSNSTSLAATIGNFFSFSAQKIWSSITGVFSSVWGLFMH